jgi:putative tryptophan/tyrosine transport system substrate-binding protein
MQRQIIGLALSTLLSVLSFPVEAQPPKKVPRVGVLNSGSRSSDSINIDSFREGLRELGYAEGKNIALEYRYADGDLGRFSNLASELVQLKVDVIVAGELRRLLPPSK